MAKTGQFFHSSTITTDVAGVDTFYNATRVHAHPLYNSETISTGTRFKGRIETIIVRVKALAGVTKPTSISVSGACDADGDYIWFPDTPGQIALGVTTSTVGSAVYEFKLPIRHFFDSNTVYLFFKTNNGTCTVDASCIVWSE